MSDHEELEGCPTEEEEEEHSGSASPVSVESVNEEYLCTLCEEKFNQPRLLSCLHTFCLPCLEKLTKDPETDEPLEAITCPLCKQETKIPAKGCEELSQDLVMVNLLDMSAIENMQIVCTSCKAKEKAVARCSDCANFLCPNCVTAHQYMRCFENHKVVSFEDIQSGEEGPVIHKPLFCEIHPVEGMKYFCNTCQTPICNECMVTNQHQGHQIDRIGNGDEKHSEELKNLMSECKGKVSFCEEASASLENHLSDLQNARDNARDLVKETFQSYKAILEKRQESLLEEVEKLHKSQELKVMDVFHNVEKTIEKIDDGCKFTERVLKYGNTIEILCMKRQITSQLLSLINNTPNPDISVKIEFETDAEKFEQAVKEHFGHLKEDQPAPAVTQHQQSPTSHQSSFENEGFMLPPGVLSPENPGIPPVTPHSEYSTSSFGLSSVSLAASISSMSSMQSMPSTSLSERSISRNSQSPAMSDSGVSVDTGSSGSGSNTPLINLAALAKLGTVSVNNLGQITLNGQVVPGLNVNNVTGLPGHSAVGLAARGTSQIGQGDTGSGVGHFEQQTSGQGSRSNSPHIDNLANILSQLTPQPNSFDPALLGSATSGGGNSNLFLSGLGLPPPLPGGMMHPPPSTPTGLPSSNSSGSRSTTPSLENLAGLLSPSPQLNGLGAFGNPLGPNSGLGNVMAQPPGIPITGNGGGAGSGAVNPHPPFPVRASGKMSAMQIRCKFGQLGPGKGQFNSPHGFCLGADEDIVVADTNNHRIQVFEKTGEFKYQFGIPGREEGQLWYPRKVAVMRSTGKYVVCDRGNERSRMQIFTKSGHFIKKIAIRYIDIVAGLAITQQGYIVAVDSVSPTVFVISEGGDLVKWFDCSDYMREPSDIAISGKEYFVCDFKGHCVVVFNEDGQFMRRIGCENITNYPNGIDISDAGDVLVGDSHGNRFHVAVFQRDGSLIGEFECPYVKVSRCCGLKITSEGYVVTLAKNNHHVLVLNTLYIT
ncbi:B-box type zinc finger protein ncl-1 [Lingula anatina]|uniref:B-box type zinc finger protein ncl-1 n=1 Tax=Lingula anatina TaxID=7574 RepID=A0A1S3J3U7_LINAN|nr:B-box type zinc finger protein ncl-1 [Lingula anatina]|eukprot:XP_013404938.1 B-box type zinc finger protein ncl-1 [Lingula anatina]